MHSHKKHAGEWPHTGWPATSEPLDTAQNSECSPLGPTFWIGVDPLENLGGPIRKMGTLKWALFSQFVPPCRGRKT